MRLTEEETILIVKRLHKVLTTIFVETIEEGCGK